MKMKKYLWLLFAFCIMVGCGESLEDTYSDYAGDGVIHYVSKCTDVSVSPGWQRLIVKWKNGFDPTIVNVKVSWTLDGVSRDTLLDKNTTECSIPYLQNGNYEITVCAVDKEGRTSLSTPVFARPYTSEHETIMSFSRLIAKHYFVEDRLVLFFTSWDTNVESAKLSYYKEDGTPDTLKLNRFLLDANPHYLLPNKIKTDTGHPVYLHRTGRVEGCDDLITFDDYLLNHEKIYTADFKQWVKVKYGLEEITDEWVNAQTELVYDYSLTSFEDILNFPNLQKVILGPDRYLRAYTEDLEFQSQLYNLERSLFVLDQAYDIRGVTVDQYNKHYFTEMKSYVKPMGNPELPNIAYYDTSEWKITCSEKDEDDYDSHLENLFNGKVNDVWQPQLLSTMRTYEINVDMQAEKTVTGVRVVQKSFNAPDAQSQALMPGIIKVQYSDDNLLWNDATYTSSNTLGTSNGETTLIYFKTSQTVRYLKFTVSDQIYSKNFSVSLAEIGIF